MRRMRLTARICIGTVNATLFVVRFHVAACLLVVHFHVIQRFHRLYRRCFRFYQRQPQLLHTTIATASTTITTTNTATTTTAIVAADVPEGSQFPTYKITKVAGWQGHYVLRVPEVFVILETRDEWKENLDYTCWGFVAWKMLWKCIGRINLDQF